MDISPKKRQRFTNKQCIEIFSTGQSGRHLSFARQALIADNRPTQTTTAAVQRACYSQLAITLHDMPYCSQSLLSPLDPSSRTEVGPVSYYVLLILLSDLVCFVFNRHSSDLLLLCCPAAIGSGSSSKTAAPFNSTYPAAFVVCL